MIEVNNIEGVHHKVTEQAGIFSVIEHTREESIIPELAKEEYYRSEMGIRRRQLFVELEEDVGLKLQKGAMQWMAGDIESVTGIRPTNVLGKLLRSSLTNESMIKPEYRGTGLLMTEPTYRHLLIENIDDWKDGLVMEDGMFLACESDVELRLEARKTLSSATLAGEGLFNLKCTGFGYCVLESSVPRSELIEVVLMDDVLKIDGNFAICWSSSLQLTVEKSGKTMIGSGISGEGFVNVFRGSGRVLMAPLTSISALPRDGLHENLSEDREE